MEKIINNAIKESGVDDTEFSIKNKTINDNSLSFDIVVTIGDDAKKKTYTIHIDKEIEIKDKKDDEEKKKQEELKRLQQKLLKRLQQKQLKRLLKKQLKRNKQHEKY